MKKNIGKMILQVKATVKPRQKKGFQVTSQNLKEYSNKIYVDSEEYQKPSKAETFVSKEL